MSKYNHNSTGVDIPGSAMAEYEVAAGEKEQGRFNKEMHEEAQIDSDSNEIKLGYDSTHRQLRPRHIQLIGIGGTIGTALYVSIGRGLMNGGPASLFMAFTIWSVIYPSYEFWASLVSEPFRSIFLDSHPIFMLIVLQVHIHSRRD
jgi:amino acid permease